MFISSMVYRILSLIGITVILGVITSMVTIYVPSSNIAFAKGDSQSDSGSMHDCSKGSDGCYGNPYCDINDKVTCYDRYEGNDEGSSTDPQSSSYKSISDPKPPLYK